MHTLGNSSTTLTQLIPSDGGLGKIPSDERWNRGLLRTDPLRGLRHHDSGLQNQSEFFVRGLHDDVNIDTTTASGYKDNEEV